MGQCVWAFVFLSSNYRNLYFREMLVYKEGDPIYHSKMLTFYRREPFDLEASYSSPKNLPFPSADIGMLLVHTVVFYTGDPLPTTTPPNQEPSPSRTSRRPRRARPPR